MINFIAVFIGGGLGASLRHCIGLIAKKYLGLALWGTFGVNILGCFLIGYLLGVTTNRADFISSELKLFLTVGLLGGLTTFSTFSIETFCLFKEGKFINAIIYLISSIVLGLIATFIGYYLNR